MQGIFLRGGEKPRAGAGTPALTPTAQSCSAFHFQLLYKRLSHEIFVLFCFYSFEGKLIYNKLTFSIQFGKF